MVRRLPKRAPAPTLPQPLRRVFVLLLLLLSGLVVTAAEKETVSEQQCSDSAASSSGRNYYHLVVLVHGYMGSDREQEYLGEALIEESKKSIGKDDDDDDDDSCQQQQQQQQHKHQFIILNSKANVNDSTDGISKGGQRLAAEISEWIQLHTTEVQQSKQSDSTIMTLSLIGNSLGGLYSRYALAELDLFNDDKNKILPLLFCTTSSPHLGMSQETFIELPIWTEPYFAMAMRQQTMDDLFGVNNSTVVMDMCHANNKNENNDRHRHRDFLHPLQQFQKRITVANAYNTDFLVSVSSGAFLSSDSDSVHYHQGSAAAATTNTRLMKNMEHVALQVTTATTKTKTRNYKDETYNNNAISSCVNSLDELGWHKIFIDTRTILPSFMRLSTPELVPQPSYTSKDLQDQFKRYGTLLPIAHPLNMANSKTDWYRKLTKSGQPIVDALAELVVLDMIELSEKKQ